MNKREFFMLFVLCSLCLPGFVIAKQPEFVPMGSKAGRAGDSNPQAKEKASRRPEQTNKQANDKHKHFEKMRRRYLDDAGLPERRVYRRSKESEERPRNRYEDFEQKRERHRKYNEYIEQNSPDKTADRPSSGAGEAYWD